MSISFLIILLIFFVFKFFIYCSLFILRRYKWCLPFQFALFLLCRRWNSTRCSLDNDTFLCTDILKRVVKCIEEKRSPETWKNKIYKIYKKHVHCMNLSIKSISILRRLTSHLWFSKWQITSYVTSPPAPPLYTLKTITVFLCFVLFVCSFC